MTLAQWIEATGSAIEFQDVIAKYGALEIVEEFGYDAFGGNRRDIPFPQSQHTFRNVHNWVLLSDGSAVGWNESPRTGWSFPRLGKKTVAKNFRG